MEKIKKNITYRMIQCNLFFTNICTIHKKIMSFF